MSSAAAAGVQFLSNGDLEVDFSKAGITDQLYLSGGILGNSIPPAAGSASVDLNVCWAFKLSYQLSDPSKTEYLIKSPITKRADLIAEFKTNEAAAGCT